MSGKVKYMALMAAAMMSEGMDAYHVDSSRHRSSYRPSKPKQKTQLTAKQTKARKKSDSAKKARRKNRK